MKYLRQNGRMPVGEKKEESILSLRKALKVSNLVHEIKCVMLNHNADIQIQLKEVFARYGIDFSVVKNFKGAPVQGYVASKGDDSYQMIVTIRNAYADIFWFSLFHELGHIVNGDIGKNSRFVDVGSDIKKEDAADEFARNKLISEKDYQIFINGKSFGIEEISRFAATQNVMPYIVIGR